MQPCNVTMVLPLPITEYAEEKYNSSIYTDRNYQLRKVDLYPEMKQMTFTDDEVRFNIWRHLWRHRQVVNEVIGHLQWCHLLR